MAKTTNRTSVEDLNRANDGKLMAAFLCTQIILYPRA